MGDSNKGEVLIIGGGVSGVSAAVEVAELGHKVTIVEKEPSLGGRVSGMHQYFPKMCPPYCGLEIYYKRIRSNPNINVITQAEVQKIEGNAGDLTVTVNIAPRYVNGKCTACDECVEACPVERSSSFDYGLANTKAIYRPHELAFPMRYVIDDKVCPGESCSKCVSACKYDAIDLSMKPAAKELKVASVIVATGWKPYDAEKIENLHFSEYKNVINNVMMERLAAPNGPTAGKILRPSDNKEVKKVAFVQCAGSRDENHQAWCSSVCCAASLKQAKYIREFDADAQVYMYYIDLRLRGRYEDFLQKMQEDEKLALIKGKVAGIEEDKSSGDLTVEAEDIYSGKKYRETVDMVVLATGLNPELSNGQLPADVKPDKYGFFTDESTAPESGIFFAGSCKTPADVSTCIKDSNCAALKAIQCIERN